MYPSDEPGVWLLTVIEALAVGARKSGAAATRLLVFAVWLLNVAAVVPTNAAAPATRTTSALGQGRRIGRSPGRTPDPHDLLAAERQQRQADEQRPAERRMARQQRTADRGHAIDGVAE